MRTVAGRTAAILSVCRVPIVICVWDAEGDGSRIVLLMPERENDSKSDTDNDDRSKDHERSAHLRTPSNERRRNQ